MTHWFPLFTLVALLSAACAETPEPPPPPPAEDPTPRPLTASSDTLTVNGEYAAIALDQVNGLAVENGKIAVRGANSSTLVDPPASADVTRPSRRWMLVTEADVDNKRVLVFTHEESLDDFTVELPSSEAPMRFGVFERPGGGEVLVLAWGEDSRSYWGHVTIDRRPKQN
jgi:hypothetical protein